MNSTNLQTLLASDFFVNAKSSSYLKNKIEHFIGQIERDRAFVVYYIYLGTLFYFYIDDYFLKSFNAASEVYLDGVFTGWIIKLITGKEHVPFSTQDYFPAILSYCEKNGKRVFLLGSDADTVENAVNKLENEYPHLNVESNDGYFEKDKAILDKINLYNPDLIVVGMGLSIQEKWVSASLDKFKSHPVIICVGNYIDILGGRVNLPPGFFRKYNIRWLYRIFMEPRVIRRYVGGIFVVLLLIYTSTVHKKRSIWLNLFKK
ncbi:MAG TPA: WecB/TagA/CpsF family glycosyltransferase [Patescibacteria group bacterium]|nr:WecB/TagA/CpsF family glycosyltransferase [Patescibacteria group bacterium]